jgi:hypothetical protein
MWVLKPRLKLTFGYRQNWHSSLYEATPENPRHWQQTFAHCPTVDDFETAIAHGTLSVTLESRKGEAANFSQSIENI